MSGASPTATGPVARSAAQNRILDAAMALIGDHGVGGTSLQMIADAIGVTKAAVYHQFNTKNEIVIAMTERELATLESPLLAAEAESDRDVARKLLLDKVIDMSVARRKWIGTLVNDPVIIRLLGEHAPFATFVSRLYGVLLDERDDTDARVAAAVMSAAIAGSVVNPLVIGIPDDALRTSLVKVTERVLDLPD